MKDIKCFVFDFGNVVAFFDHRKACRQLAALTEDRWSPEEIYEEMFRAGGLEEQYDRGEIDTAAFIAQIRRKFEIKDDEAKIEEAWCDMFWLNSNMVRLLRRLKEKSFKLILASNTNQLHHEWFKNKFKAELSCFENEFVLSYKIHHRKPDRAFFARCIEQTRYHPAQCVYVDDRQDFVEVARKMGMQGVVVENLIYSLSELGIVNGPSLEEFGSSISEATNLAIYKEKYANFRHFDTLRWGIPGLVFVVGGAIVITAPRGEQTHPKPWILFLYGTFVLLCAWLMRRIGYHMKRNADVLKTVAARVSDHAIPLSPGITGAAFWMEAFIWLLGMGALVIGAYKFWSYAGALAMFILLGSLFGFQKLNRRTRR